MQKLCIFALILQLSSRATHSTSSILPFLPPTRKSCLFHFIFHKGHEKFYEEHEQLNYFISKGEISDYSDVFLVSSYSSYTANNVSSSDDEDGEFGTQRPPSPKFIQFRWRVSECFRFLILNSDGVMNAINSHQVSFWKYSELPEIIIRVPEIDKYNRWNWETIVGMKDAGDFNGFKARIYFLVIRANAINNHGHIVKLGFLCFMCPQQTSIQWIITGSSVDEKRAIKYATDQRKISVNVGHKRKLYLKYVPDLTNLEEVLFIYNYYINHITKN